jgi:GT2 family glycosyltransferase
VVWAVVVTHNRVALLEQCLYALRAQTRAPDRILVVDNASTDGTADLLARQQDVTTLTLSTNKGSSGGFHDGMRRAHADGAEWLWLMDDDTIPRPGALAALLDADTPARVRSSKVEWTDGRLHPMNLPGIERERIESLIDAAPHHTLPLKVTTWVSLLVHRSVIDEHGLPDERFFIWSDDLEYTSRITHHGGRIDLVPASVAEHRTQTPHTAVSEAGERFYFHVRNTLYMVRGRSWSGPDKVSLLYLLGLTTAQYMKQGGSAKTVARGLRDGLLR